LFMIQDVLPWSDVTACCGNLHTSFVIRDWQRSPMKFVINH